MNTLERFIYNFQKKFSQNTLMSAIQKILGTFYKDYIKKFMYIPIIEPVIINK